MDFDTKKLIVKESIQWIHRQVQKYSVAVIGHDGQAPLENGSGTLLEIEGQKLVVTAAHVVNKYKVTDIQITGSQSPSNWKMAPRLKEAMGGGPKKNADVAYLVLDPDTIELLQDKEFMTLDRLDIFPKGLSNDLVLFFGFLLSKDSIREDFLFKYVSDGFIDNLPFEFEWGEDANRPFSMDIPYPTSVLDVTSDELVELPNPHGKSGGGLWRIAYQKDKIWMPSDVKFLGVNIEWHEKKEGRIVRVNRAEVLLRLHARNFSSARKYLDEQLESISLRSGASSQDLDPSKIISSSEIDSEP